MMGKDAALLTVAEPVDLLVEELPSWLTAWEACQRLATLPRVLFFDSAATLPTLGRYSFVTADPFAWLWSRGKEVHWHEGADLNVARCPQEATDPFAVLAHQLARFRIQPVPGLPPFQGGAAGLLGYDLCHHIERLPRPGVDEFAAPDMAVGFYDWVLAFDHLRKTGWILSTGLPDMAPHDREARARARLRQVLRTLEEPPRYRWTPPEPITPAAGYPLPGFAGILSSFDRQGYLDAIQRAIDYVHAGDCFQVNVAQRLLHPATLPPLEVYRHLRERNPAPFAGYFDLGEHVIASASPERFLRVEKGEVETRPIKGTRPRGLTPMEDAARAGDLLTSAKDRAENIMIVDLLRNDLGRVCAYGSVRVPHVCKLESYRYVHHLVSEVRGSLRPEYTLVDLLRASFPGGSITGAPKVRAMEIIAELEPTVRGPYCGCLGYLGFDGSMDTNLLIRTITLGKGWMQLPVGGGIVADSQPQNEYEETLHKAQGLLRALTPG